MPQNTKQYFPTLQDAINYMCSVAGEAVAQIPQIDGLGDVMYFASANAIIFSVRGTTAGWRVVELSQSRGKTGMTVYPGNKRRIKVINMVWWAFNGYDANIHIEPKDGDIYNSHLNNLTEQKNTLERAVGHLKEMYPSHNVAVAHIPAMMETGVHLIAVSNGDIWRCDAHAAFTENWLRKLSIRRYLVRVTGAQKSFSFKPAEIVWWAFNGYTPNIAVFSRKKDSFALANLEVRARKTHRDMSYYETWREVMNHVRTVEDCEIRVVGEEDRAKCAVSEKGNVWTIKKIIKGYVVHKLPRRQRELNYSVFFRSPVIQKCFGSSLGKDVVWMAFTGKSPKGKIEVIDGNEGNISIQNLRDTHSNKGCMVTLSKNLDEYTADFYGKTKSIINWLYWYLGREISMSDCEDIVSEAFYLVCSVKDMNRERFMAAWFKAIRYQFMVQIKRKERYMSIFYLYDEEGEERCRCSIPADEYKEPVKAWCDKFIPHDRGGDLLRQYINGETISDIAKNNHTSINAVNALLLGARKRLRSHFRNDIYIHQRH